MQADIQLTTYKEKTSLQYKYNASQHPTYQLEIEYEPTLKVTNMNRMQANPKLPNTNRKQANIQLTKKK